MTEIVIAGLLALALPLIAAAAAQLRALSRSLERVERLLEAMAAARALAGTEPARADVEQERYAEGLANILRYGSREFMRRGGEAQ